MTAKPCQCGKTPSSETRDECDKRDKADGGVGHEVTRKGDVAFNKDGHDVLVKDVDVNSADVHFFADCKKNCTGPWAKTTEAAEAGWNAMVGA